MRVVVSWSCMVLVAGCGLLGGGTTLRGGYPPTDGFRFDDADTIDHRYMRVSDINLCTDGDDAVTVTAVRVTGRGAPKVIAFRVGHAQYNDGSAGSSRLDAQPVTRTGGPSRPFTQRCDGDELAGRTFLTIDMEVGALPVETSGIAVSYRTGGDRRSVVIDVPIVLCGPSVGCPADPDDS